MEFCPWGKGASMHHACIRTDNDTGGKWPTSVLHGLTENILVGRSNCVQGELLNFSIDVNGLEQRCMHYY